MKIDWSSINNSRLSKIIKDDSSGVYAWYYQIKLSNFDSNQLVEKVENSASISERKAIVKNFLNKNLFSFFRYPDFEAKISVSYTHLTLPTNREV